MDRVRIAQKIAMESRDCSRNGNVYQTKINMDVALQPVHVSMEDIMTRATKFMAVCTEALREAVCLTCALMYGQRKWQDERSQQLLS